MLIAHIHIYRYIYDRLLSWLGTGTSIKSGWVKLALWAQASSLSEMMQVIDTYQLFKFITILALSSNSDEVQ